MVGAGDWRARCCIFISIYRRASSSSGLELGWVPAPSRRPPDGSFSILALQSRARHKHVPTLAFRPIDRSPAVGLDGFSFWAFLFVVVAVTVAVVWLKGGTLQAQDGTETDRKRRSFLLLLFFSFREKRRRKKGTEARRCAVAGGVQLVLPRRTPAPCQCRKGLAAVRSQFPRCNCLLWIERFADLGFGC